MPKVNYVAFSGARHAVDVPEGENVMRGALYNSIEGIEGECGGACSCATCHCYVDDAWMVRVGGPVSEAELELLEGAAAEVRPNSRLSCQITMSADLDGLIVHLPERQY
jgi:2Fe-2S ferredoxin